MNTKSKNTTTKELKKTISEMVDQREYEQKRQDEAFTYKVKSDTKDKTVTLKNFSSGSRIVSLV